MIVSVIAAAPLMTNSGQQARGARLIFRLHLAGGSKEVWTTLWRWWSYVDGRVYDQDNGQVQGLSIPNDLALPTLYEVRRMAP